MHCSRARSLLMDEKIWNPTLVEASLFPLAGDRARPYYGLGTMMDLLARSNLGRSDKLPACFIDISLN